MATKRVKFIKGKGYAMKGYITELPAEVANGLIDGGFAVELKVSEPKKETKFISTQLVKKGK